MNFPGLDHRYTGILVPVAALRSSESCGIGEFLDIVPLARWCSDVGLEMVQILPVNDTGFDASPYSAVSAFALNPIYLRISALPELKRLSRGDSIHDRLSELRERFESAGRVAYGELLTGKLEILRRMFERTQGEIEKDAERLRWMEENRWLKAYAVYRVLRRRNGDLPWPHWPERRDPSPHDIDVLWETPELADDLTFHVWLQYRLEQQLRDAAEQAESFGVYLKGDLPILMNEDSADIWAHREIFMPELRAGAPPDMFSHLGQNWNFPVYRWDRLARHDFDWWKRRLRQADKFYHAYRIDHVLGFFRIWAIPYRNVAGTMGFFYPSALISEGALNEAGFDSGRVRWLARPHLTRKAIRQEFGEREEQVRTVAFTRLDEEELYVLQEEIRGERDILELDLTDGERDSLLMHFRDRALLQTGFGDDGGALYAPTWEYRECSRYRELSDEEKQRFEALVAERRRESETIWEEQGRQLLSFMNSTVPMLTCAEDLGVIPESVPRTLAELGILGMRVPRWARQYERPGEPYIAPQEYPLLTVCAPSVHDTSTLRQWWEQEADRHEFWAAVGLSGPAPDRYDAETCRRLLGAILQTSSAICMLQIQDLFALDPELIPDDPTEERVNVPGTYNEWNWGYRIPLPIEELQERTAFVRAVRELVADRERSAV